MPAKTAPLQVSRSADFRKDELMVDGADTKYLHQKGFEDRLAAFQRGEFYYIGLRASVEIPVCGVLQTLQSAGLFEIESDSSADYLNEVYEEQADELAGILNALGIEIID